MSRSMYLYNQAVAADPSGPVFFDRSVMEPIAYWRSVGKLEPYLEQVVAQYRYATDVFMVPPWPEIFIKDAERQHSYDHDQSEYARLTDSFQAFGYRLIEIPRVSVSDRADFVESHLRSIGVL
ncbi:MAG: AAA family ATPase [bacterium]